GVERIRAVAQRVAAARVQGHDVAVVVSAMAGETDRLVGFCREIAPLSDGAEADVVVASGEQVTSGLLALALQSMGVPARSLQGWQAPVRTTAAHGAARITEIGTDAIEAALAAGEVVVVPGFQGVTHQGRITTLGRGGSDTSAVALAAAIRADECLIFTDVEGVFTTDPRIVPRARKLERISYEEMLELASVGAKVLHARSVELAMKHNVRLAVLSSFSDAPGTWVVSEEEIVESQHITGVAYNRNEAKVTVRAVPDRPGAVAEIFAPVAQAGVNVDMIVQNVSDHGTTDVTFTVPATELARSLAALEAAKPAVGFGEVITDTNVCKVSVVGIGMRSHAGIAMTMFRALGERGINIQAIATSEIKISVLIAEEYTELAVRVLHTAFGLDG
ncbi:MAG: aspartate kinase, partial [Sphingomonadaceae bacterium]